MSSVNHYHVTTPTEAWVVYYRISRIVESAWTLKREANKRLRNNNSLAIVKTTLPIYTHTSSTNLHVQSDGLLVQTVQHFHVRQVVDHGRRGILRVHCVMPAVNQVQFERDALPLRLHVRLGSQVWPRDRGRIVRLDVQLTAPGLRIDGHGGLDNRVIVVVAQFGVGLALERPG